MAAKKIETKDELGYINRDRGGKKRKLNYKGIAILAIILLLAGGGSWYAYQQIFTPQMGSSLPVFNEELLAQDHTIDILLMGMDARGNETVGRTDTMMLLSIHNSDKKAVLISIPRDTIVKNSKGYNSKINALNATEDAESACRAVSDLLHVNVDHYVLVNFDGFAALIDILGGVDFNVPAAMYHWDPDPKLTIDIKAGQQHMDGRTALNYVRFRGTPSRDIGRVQRQQEFLNVLFDELMQAKTIKKLPAMVTEMYEYVATNMTIKEMASLAGLAKDFSTENIVCATLPGKNHSDKVLGSCWKADEEIAPRLVEALLAGESIETWSDAPSSYSYDLSSSLANTTDSTAAAEPASGSVIPEYIDIPVLEDDEESEAGDEQGGEGAGLPPEDDAEASAVPAGTDTPATDDTAPPTDDDIENAPAADNSDSEPEIPGDQPGGLPAPLE